MYLTAFLLRHGWIPVFSLLILLTLSGGAATAQTSVADDFRALQIVQIDKKIKAPDLTLTMTSGETLRLSDLQGNVILLNFWATW